MIDTDKIFDEITDLLQEGAEQFEGGPNFTDLETAQPVNASWVVLDASLRVYATDVWAAIRYDDAQTMQEAIIRLVKAAWTPQLLEHVRSGEIENLTLRIGPDTLSGCNLNEENGIETDTKKYSKGI